MLTACRHLQLKRMEMEAHSFAPERARQLTVRVKEYKADLAKLRSDARTAATQVLLPLLTRPAVARHGLTQIWGTH